MPFNPQTIMEKHARIYISGHRGMVGRTMLDLLKRKGFNTLITRTSSELDLCDQKAVYDFFFREKPEYILHFAAQVGGIMANLQHPADFLFDNLVIATNVIGAARKTGAKKLLNLGSSCVYPRDCPQPMKEESLLTGLLEPTNEGYALGKIAALKLCEKFNQQYKTDFISLMPCNIYGIYERFDPIHSHVISALIMKFHAAKGKGQPSITLWGTGKARREFLYVEDLACATLHFMERYSAEDLGNQFVNIGSGEDISIKDLAYLIARIVGFKGEIRWDSSKPDGMPQKLLDVTRMKSFHFQPTILLEEGIGKTYAYYLSQS